MYIVFFILGSIATAILVFAVYRFIVAGKQNRKINARKLERVKPLYDKLESGQALSEADILPFATNILTREITFQLLSKYNKEELFPKEFYSIEKAAESNLANWLEFPTELDACPDEMEFVQKVTIDLDNHNVYYYVFKFRVNQPHWAAKNNWMLGVVGPYFDDSKPYDFPGATFSRLTKLDAIPVEEETRWVHEMSVRRL